MPRTNVLVQKRTAPELFEYQVSHLIEIGLPLVRGMSELEFRATLEPLSRLALALPKSTAHVPALLVIPHTWMPTSKKRQYKTLVASMNSSKLRVLFEASSDLPNDNFRGPRGVPGEPYLAIDVCDGRELEGVIYEEDNNPLERTFTESKLLPLTLDVRVQHSLRGICSTCNSQTKLSMHCGCAVRSAPY